jgi:hypothetical protein
MNDLLNGNPRFRQASRYTAHRLLKVLEQDGDAFSDETRRQPRLTAAERLERRRQRRTA